MAETEAACLLRTGALYVKRVGWKGSAGEPIFAGVKRGAFSLYIGDAPVYHFDLEGRWQRAFIDGIHYRKSLDNTVDAVDRVREGAALVIKRRTLRFAEVANLDDQIRDVAIQLLEELNSEHLVTQSPPENIELLGLDDLVTILDGISRWDASSWFSHREKYVAAYGREPIFAPPDAQNAIILQATGSEGFFRTPQEFADHVRGVAALLGKRAILATNVFLADGSLLLQPTELLQAYLEVIKATFPFDFSQTPKRPKDRPFDRPELSGIEVLFDSTGTETETNLPDAAAWKILAEGRIRRMTLRIHESGPDLLPFLEGAQSAGVSLAILLDHGRLVDEPLTAIVGRVNALPLGSGDIVYLLNQDGGSEEELATARSYLKEALAPVRIRGAKIAPYNQEKQWN